MGKLIAEVENLNLEHECEIYIKKMLRDKRAKILYKSIDKNFYPNVKSPKEWVENQYQERYLFKLTGGTWRKDEYYLYYKHMYEKTENNFRFF